MDPLSIAASAASLAGAASIITVGLAEMIKNIKNVDNKISDLSKEVSQLTDLLKSVGQVVQQCQSQALTLAHLDHQMWQQIENALVDCNVNLQGLETLVSRLSNDHDAEANNITRLLKKPSRHFHLTVNKDEISDYTSKIYKSNCAMQTALAVVTVSLTFRANVSQESLFQELHDLKGLVQETLKVANRQEAVPDPFAARQRRNLADLARAAQKFHIAASSTASTLPGANDRYSLASWGGSERGALSEAEVERIEDWKLKLSTVEESTEDSMTEVTGTSGYGDSLTTITSPDLDDSNSNAAKKKEMGVLDEDEDEDDDESDVEYDFLRNYEELAYASFVEGNYEKAERFLRMAVEQSTGDASGDTDFKKIKFKLALCCCLQEKWDHATGIITALPKTRSQANLPLFYLLQAITLAHLQGERLDDAYSTCKVVLQGKKKIIGRDSNDYNECLSILATICERRGSDLEAEAVRHSIPRGWRSRSPRSPTQYILHHTTLIKAIFPQHNDEQRQTHEETRDQRQEIPTSQETNEPDPSPMSPDSSKSPDLEVNASASGHWTTLIPNVPRDGFHRAERDERKGTLVEETDTGKEFIGFSVPGINVNLASESQPAEPVRRPPPPIPAPVSQTQDDRFSRNPWRKHLLSAPKSPPPPRPASPKRHAPSRSADLSGLRSGFGSLGISESDTGLGRSFSQRLSSSQAATLESSGSISRSLSHRHSVASPWGASDSQRSVPNIEVSPPPNQMRPREQEATSPVVTSPTQDYNRPASHQRLIDQVRQAQERRPSHEDNSFARRQQQRPPLPRDAYIEQIVTSPHPSKEPVPPIEEPEEPEEPEDEPYSTLEVIDTGYSQDYGPTSPTSPIISPTYASHIRRHNSTADPRMSRRIRMRWTVQKDICNTGGPRPFGLSGHPQFLPLKRVADTEETYVAVTARFRSAASIVLSKGEGGVTMCQLPITYQEHSPVMTKASSLDMRRLFRKMSPGGAGSSAESSQTDSSTYTVGIQNPRDWFQVYNTTELTGTYYQAGPDDREQRALSKSNTRLMELEIANMMRQGQAAVPNEAIASLRLQGIVYALPDFLDRTYWKYWTDILGESGLMQHAKVIPQSYAIMQYYLDCGALSINYSHVGPGSVVVVLNCEEILVDCVPFSLQLVSPDYVEVVELGTSSMAEMTGSRHARVEFARVVDERLKVTTSQLRQKIDAATIDGIIRSCCDQFESRILPAFEDDGRDWTVDFEMPQGVFGFQTGRHKFSNAEILRCFTPSVALIKKMLEQTVERLHDCQESVSYVLLAGHYTKSKYLVSELRRSVSNLRFGNLGPPLELVHAADQPDLCALGALSHVIGS